MIGAQGRSAFEKFLLGSVSRSGLSLTLTARRRSSGENDLAFAVLLHSRSRVALPADADAGSLARHTAGMGQEQAKEREELEKMHNEVKDIKGTINDAVESLNQLNNQAQSQNVHEFHLFAKDAQCEVYSGLSVGALTYNGKIPGPAFCAFKKVKWCGSFCITS